MRRIVMYAREKGEGQEGTLLETAIHHQLLPLPSPPSLPSLSPPSYLSSMGEVAGGRNTSP